MHQANRLEWTEETGTPDGEAAPTPIMAGRRKAVTLARLMEQLEAQAVQIREQAASLAHSRKVFERASAVARIGVWECELAGEVLRWTDVVYDIFDLPVSVAPDRAQALACYSEASRRALETARRIAIENRSGFSLDAEITTMRGASRWIRITATVECEDGVPVRIFGMKQDITDEKILQDRTRYLAQFDVITGLANRSRFQERLSALDAPGAEGHAIGALLLVDLDDFKQINDTWGHAAGDHALKDAAARLAAICQAADLVARIGGDEFGVILGAHVDRATVEHLAQTVVQALGCPSKTEHGQVLKLGASVGLALAQGCTSSELFTKADTALYAAKAAGRGAFRMFGA